jgi:hypothetical protein
MLGGPHLFGRWSILKIWQIPARIQLEGRLVRHNQRGLIQRRLVPELMICPPDDRAEHQIGQEHER